MSATNLNHAEADNSSTHIRHHTAHLDASVVLEWNQHALEAIQATAATPPYASRALAMESLAVFDVINAIRGTPGYLVDLDAPHRISATAAVVTAAERILSYSFPDQKATFAAELTRSLEAVPDGPRETKGVAFGTAVADAIIAVRAHDGSDAVMPYAGGTEPGEWRPTPPGYLPALLPQWGSVTPFALTRGDQFRPDGPPEVTSAAYAAEFNEVKRLGSASPTERTAEQTEIAQFWADGPGSYTPPGHWNQIATGLAATEGLSGVASARLLAELNVALADVAIAAWDAKYTYGSWRPVTAIRLADTDGNAATVVDPDWTPLLTTPNHPDYVAGHATFSAAAATILTEVFGAQAFAATSITLPGVTRCFDSFAAAAEEAGHSRIYAGIHFPSAVEDGLALGHQVGDWVLEAFRPSCGGWDLLA